MEATQEEPWLRSILEKELDKYTAKDQAHLRLIIQRLENNIDISGNLRFSLHPNCDRCLENYPHEESLLIHLLLAPLYENKRQQKQADEKELVREDFEFGYYEGEQISLTDIVREQLILSRPMKYLCREDCQGLCSHCGKNLNQGACDCKVKTTLEVWAPLKAFRPKKN